MQGKDTLAAPLKRDGMLYMPAVYYPLGGCMVEQVGFDAAYVGGFMTGGDYRHPEQLGQSTEAMLADVGYSPGEIASLRATGVTGAIE